MKVKRFKGTDMRDAMTQVRETFGPDAVILSNQNHHDGSEIIAAINYDAALKGSKLPNHFFLDHADASAVEVDPLAELKAQLAALTATVERQNANLQWREDTRNAPNYAWLYKRCIDMGLEPDLTRDLMASITLTNVHESNFESLIYNLKSRILIEPRDLLWEGGVLAVVGPTGVGKTTTIAKLASRFVLQNDVTDLALLTTDTHRIAAYEHLQRYASILGSPVQVAQSAEQLSALLEKLSHKKLILIDTPGMGQNDPRLKSQLSLLSAASSDIQTSLMLSCTSQTSVLKETIDAFRHGDFHHCIISKIDEATQIGSALSVVIQAKLPLGFTCHGQRVPEDITPASQEGLITQLLMKSRQHAMPTKDVSFEKKISFGESIDVI